MLSLLRTGRWQAFTAAAVTAIVAFGLLSVWQWHRAEDKRAEFALIEEAVTAPPLDAAVVSDPRDWQAVSATGQYDADQQFLVRNRPQDGRNGFWVVTLLRSQPDLWVVRGWTPVDLALGVAQTAPAPPAGQVTVSGYARLPEPAPLRAAADVPAPQISALNVAELSTAGGATAQPWFLVADNDPLLPPVPVPEPTDSRNLSYAGQWLLFAAIAIGGWYFFLKREARDVADQRAAEHVPVTSGR